MYDPYIRKGTASEHGRNTGTLPVLAKRTDCVSESGRGEITNINPAVNYRLHYTGRRYRRGRKFLQKIRGIVLKNHGDRKYAAVWDDMPADVEHMKIWERKEEPIEMEEEAEEEEEKEAEKSEVEEKADEREELEDSSKTREIQEERRPLHANLLTVSCEENSAEGAVEAAEM